MCISVTVPLYIRIYIYCVSSTSSEVGVSRLDADRLAWIPNKILHSYYQNSSEDRLCVERCLLSCIIPVTLPAEDRMLRLTHVFSRLDAHASRAFEELLRNREQYVSMGKCVLCIYIVHVYSMCVLHCTCMYFVYVLYHFTV